MNYIVTVNRQSGAAVEAREAYLGVDTSRDPDEFSQYNVERATDERDAMSLAEAIHLGVVSHQQREAGLTRAIPKRWGR